MLYRCFILNIFTLYTVAHLVNTTLHKYVDKCTTVLEKKNIYLPRCFCGSYTDEYNTVIPDAVGTQKKSVTYQISYSAR